MTRRLAHAAGAASLAALMVACSVPATRHEVPAAPVAAAFPMAPAGAAAGPVAADLAWQQFFADARLKRLIGLALDGNRDLRLAVLAIEQARAQLAVRQADAWPTVNAGLAASRTPRTDGTIASAYTAGVQVTAYEVDLFGRVRSLSDVAAAQLLATEEARRAVHIGLVATVANAYLAMQADDELLRVTRQTLDTRTESLRLIKLRFDNGASSQLDLRQAESLQEAARAALAQGTRQRALDENALVLLLGQPLPADLPPGLPVTAQALPELPVGVPSEVLTRRPDVRQAEQQLIAADANIGAARAAFFPRITLTGSLGLASGELSGLFQGGNLAWSFAPQLLQPLFDAGRNRAGLKLAEVAREQAVAQYERAIQSAFREVADALAGRATLGDQLSAQQAQVAAEQDRVRLADLRYRNGASSFLDLLDAQRSLFAAQQALVQVQAQKAQNGVTLYRVLGGGWAAAQ
ncbi:efflux transporter outer membrane subunit [Ideonella sp. A 288]|uniref:efflux transporter outer membrane subunit n=1 Tax=Ideonella sp. A 288 TaxID=1962181 RepID=UPI000B4ADA20|nr:efflux transporter outer membrane subunit [Ideonella sp. A 288]